MVFINALEKIKIENLVYIVRGKQVMLDKDLAMLYKCKNGTKSINLAVNRNKDKLPIDFCFRLTSDETQTIFSRFHFETLNEEDIKRSKNFKYLPYVFTEQGVAMLSSVLKTEVAN